MELDFKRIQALPGKTEHTSVLRVGSLSTQETVNSPGTMRGKYEGLEYSISSISRVSECH